VAAARTNIADYFDRYNTERPHSKLDRQTPQQTLDEFSAEVAQQIA
jgi:transposase InsO family protein